MNSPDKKYSFEEFKLIYDSAEKVTDRRISMNKTNYSVSTAIFVGIAYLFNLSVTDPKFLYIGSFAIITLSILAFIFTFYWIQQIKDYKSLNTAKFNVINEMSEHLHFEDSNHSYAVTSFQPFLKEWQELKNMEALQSKKKFNLIGLKSSNIEYFIPQAFRILFASIFIGIIIFIVFYNNWISCINDMSIKQ